MKPKNYKERDNEKVFGKKRYLERLAEEEEADKEIEEFDPEREEDNPDERYY